METYNYNDFKEAGIDVQFVQDNLILLRYDYNNAIIPPEKRQVQLSL